MEQHARQGRILRLLVADESHKWREELAAHAAQRDVTVVAKAATAGDCADATRRLRPDVALIDIALPGGGLMTTARLVARHPRLQVVITAHEIDGPQLLAALRAGAQGVVLKSEPLDRLAWSLHAVMAGQVAVPRRLVNVLVNEFTRYGTRRRKALELPGSQRLSSREHQAVSLLLEGFTTLEIADEMYVSPGSVRTYLSRALAKLRVPDRDALRALAVQARPRR